ncbi:hypothetical protein [Alteripontixanthobacter muriae]|uniref:hypothetical protein n=1 Tax=Alteripontixanthobacter muriae TaxID=2705546 RepID=UPI0019D5ED4B|nr:hypothetical protein [Alteripontixanthobacter muriae]
MPKKPLTVDALTHDEDTRKNASTAELEAFVDAEIKRPMVTAYERRNKDLDPQLVWRGKDVADWATSWSTHRRSIFKRRSIPRRSSRT